MDHYYHTSNANIHRGIYTTQSEFKRSFRRLERCLQTWEAARVLNGGEPIPEHAWQRPLHAVSQHTPSTHGRPLAHCELAAHAPPLASSAVHFPAELQK